MQLLKSMNFDHLSCLKLQETPSQNQQQAQEKSVPGYRRKPQNKE